MSVYTPLLRLRIVASQLAASLFPHEENLVSILARRGRIVVERPGSQLYRLLIGPREKACLLAHNPDMGYTIVGRLEEEISPVRRPIAATFGGRGVPAGKQLMKVFAIGGHFPQRV